MYLPSKMEAALISASFVGASFLLRESARFASSTLDMRSLTRDTSLTTPNEEENE